MTDTYKMREDLAFKVKKAMDDNVCSCWAEVAEQFKKDIAMLASRVGGGAYVMACLVDDINNME
jgi:hypothetical protein